MDKKLRQELRLAYDKRVASRDARPYHDWKKNARNGFAALLRGEGKLSLLEIGAGTGIDGVYFRDEGFAITCTDLAPENVQACRQKGLDARVMDVCQLEFAPASFAAVYSFNCLLHLPKPELPQALRAIHRVLEPGGLFYLGLYGGFDFAGVWDDDNYEPKRFFSFHSDAALERKLTQFFALDSFQRISADTRSSDLHFQSFILRKAQISEEEK